MAGIPKKKKKSRAKKAADIVRKNGKMEVLPPESKEERTLAEIRKDGLDLFALEEDIRANIESSRSNSRNILRSLFLIYENRDSLMEASHLELCADKRNGKFSFSRYIELLFHYARSTAIDYAGILSMLADLNMSEVLDKKYDISILRAIRVFSKDDGIRKKLLKEIDSLDRLSFQVRALELAAPDKPPKKKPIPYLRRLEGFQSLKKKLDTDKGQLTIKGRDKFQLKKLDTFLDLIDAEILEKLIDDLRN